MSGEVLKTPHPPGHLPAQPHSKWFAPNQPRTQVFRTCLKNPA